MNKNYWLKEEDLTSNDVLELVRSVRPYLIHMEDEGFFSTAEDFRDYLFQSFDLMLETLEKIFDPEHHLEDIIYYARYPKINQLLSYEGEIFSVEERTNKVMEDYGTETICAAIEAWWCYKIMELN